ncbi:hypothetical protein [Methylorubrum populi]
MARRRSKRILAPEDRQDFLAEAGTWRAACIRLMTRAPINEPFYRALTEVTAAIDSVAEAVTGHRNHFHNRMHSAPPPGWTVAKPQAAEAAPASLPAVGIDGAGRCGGE